MPHVHPVPSASAFVDGRLLVSGPLAEVALTLHRTGTDGVIVLDDATGRLHANSERRDHQDTPTGSPAGRSAGAR